MKKYLILLWIISLAASLLSTQVFVVGELLTIPGCGPCLPARSALLQMYDNTDEFEFLIPLIWMGGGTYASPNYAQRASLYSVSGVPHAQWGGYLSHVGAGADVYNQYVQRYNMIVNNTSPVELEIDFEITDNNLIQITADAELVGNIQTTNNKILFIITYNLEAEFPGEDYFAQVMRYNEQNFNLTSTGQSGEFTHSFNLEGWWDLAKAHIVVLIQTFSGNRVIHQAAAKRISEYVAPSGLIGFPGNSQATLSWNTPNSQIDIIGYNIYQNDVLINNLPPGETIHTVTGLQNDVSYTFYVTALYDDQAESHPSNSVSVVPFAAPPGQVQIGSGTTVNTNTQAAPINVWYRSLRGQMVYTAQEINLAGFTGPGEIQSLGFFIHSPPIHNLPSFHIRLKHTDAVNAIEHDNGPFETTHVIPSYAPTSGIWELIELQEPFYWNGTDNILVDTAFDLVPGWNSSGQLRVYNAHNGYRYSISDVQSQINAVTTSIMGYKPQIRIQFIYTEPPDHPAPENLIAESGDGVVDLSWDPPSVSVLSVNDPVHSIRNLLGYNVYRDGEIINTETVEETTYSDTDVINGVTYAYYVTALYDTGESQPSNSVEATPQSDINPNPTVAHSPNPYDEALDVPLDTPIGWTYTSDPLYTDPIGYKVNMWTEDPTGEPFTAFVPGGPGEYYFEQHPFEFDYETTYYWQVIPTTIETSGEGRSCNSGVWLQQISGAFLTGLRGDAEDCPIWSFTTVTDTSIEVYEVTLEAELRKNYPNPFNPETTIEFSLAQPGIVQIVIYDIKGQMVRSLLHEHRDPGKHHVVWDGTDQRGREKPSGVFLYRLVTEERVFTRKMLMIK